MMLKAIQNFPRQFLFVPYLENARHLGRAKKFIVCGMGGSNLTAGLLLIAEPALNIIAHKDYGLPQLSHAELKQHLVIAVSYSGNTEETIAGFQEARRRKLTLAVVATGGKLLALAKKYRVPYVQIPEDGIQPRMAVGYTAKALLQLMGRGSIARGLTTLVRTLDAAALSAVGRRLAIYLKGYVPVIYASTANQALAYTWKIKFNETGKIPAFFNVFPELNHNEMTGFDIARSTATFARRFRFIFLADRRDHPKIARRMQVCKKLYEDRGLKVKVVPVKGDSAWQAIMSSLMIADFAAYYAARAYRVEPEQVPMVEEFKKMIR